MPKRSRISTADKLAAAKQKAMRYFSRQGIPARTAPAARSDPKHNLMGIGIGHKLMKGKSTGDHSIRFYVERKLRKVPKHFLLPEQVGGIRTDVIETGRFHAFSHPQRRRMRPVRPGSSIGCQPKPGAVMAGTFAAIVAKGRKHYILSNNHVLASENKLPKGSPIFQPGLRDKNAPSKNQVAKLSRFIKLRAATPNKVDCAIAVLLAEWDPVVLPRVNKLKSGIPIRATTGMRVEKIGRTSGYTTGTIEDVNLTLKVGYDSGTLTFVDQILIKGDGRKSFGKGGDSGSLVVDRNSKRPVGLMFGGGSGSFAIANHVSDVLQHLGVRIIA